MRGFAAAAFVAVALVDLASCQALLVFDNDRGPNGASSVDGGVDAARSDAGVEGEDGAPPASNLEILAEHQPGPHSIALSARYIYWANTGANAVGVRAKQSDPVTTIDTGSSPAQYVVADLANVYWASALNDPCGRGIMKAGEGGNGVSTLTACTKQLADVVGFAQNGDSVFWATSRYYVEIDRASKGGGVAFTVAGGGAALALPDVPGALAATSQSVFWARPALGLISRKDLALGKEPVDLDAGVKGIRSIAADDTNVYFASDSTVVRMNAMGGAPEVVAPDQKGVLELAVADGYLYWTVSDPGAIRRVSVTGTGFDTLISGQSGIRSLAVDSTHVYFTRDSGEICRIPR